MRATPSSMALVNGIDVLNSWLSGYNLFRRPSDISAMFLTALGLAMAVATIILFARRRGSNVRSWFSEPEQRTTEDEDPSSEAHGLWYL